MTQEEIDRMQAGDRFVEVNMNCAYVWNVVSKQETASGYEITICDGKITTTVRPSLILRSFCIISPKNSDNEKFKMVEKKWSELKTGDMFLILSDNIREHHYKYLHIWEKTDNQFDVENMKTKVDYKTYHNVWKPHSFNQNVLHLIPTIIDLI